MAPRRSRVCTALVTYTVNTGRSISPSPESITPSTRPVAVTASTDEPSVVMLTEAHHIAVAQESTCGFTGDSSTKNISEPK